MSDFDYSVLQSVAHRPWPLPHAPWVMTQSWHDVLFAHWRVDVATLRTAVPAVFDLDLYQGEAWVGVVPFCMRNVGMRGSPPIPGTSAFPELNVRTYVRVGNRPGVYFFSLDAARWLPVATARAFLNLPYFRAAMTVEREKHRVRYQCSRRTGCPARFHATYEPVGETFTAQPRSLEYFLTERYCLYHQHRRGLPYRLDIHHRPWPLQQAAAVITENTMAEASNLPLTGEPEVLHFARRVDVLTWAPSLISAPAARDAVPSPAT